MVTTLFLVRHGETEGSETKRYKGSIDVPLSENGIEQIKRTSAFIDSAVRKLGERDSPDSTTSVRKSGTVPLSAVYCSPLGRAFKSAEIIAAPHQLVPVPISDLRERSFGIWEGMTFTEIRDKYPVEFEAWAGNPLVYSPMAGESTIDVRNRVIPVIEKILSEARKNGSAEERKAGKENIKGNSRASELPGLRTNIAIVAHGGVNRVLLCHVLGIPLENIFRIEQDNAAVNIIEFWDNYPVVKLLNGVLGG